MSRITIQDLWAYKARGERFAMLTAYDYPTAELRTDMAAAAAQFAEEVRSGVYPSRDYAYNWTLQ